MAIPEYVVYCGIFITHRWSERFVQTANGEFGEVPHNLWHCFRTPYSIFDYSTKAGLFPSFVFLFFSQSGICKLTTRRRVFFDLVEHYRWGLCFPPSPPAKKLPECSFSLCFVNALNFQKTDAYFSLYTYPECTPAENRRQAQNTLYQSPKKDTSC